MWQQFILHKLWLYFCEINYGNTFAYFHDMNNTLGNALTNLSKYITTRLMHINTVELS